MKIVSTGSTISSPEFYKKKLKARRQKLIISFSLLLVLVVLSVLVLRLDKFRISEVSVSGAIVTPEEPLISLVQEMLSGSYLWILPKDSALLYPASALRERLAEKFPRLSSIELSLPDLKSLHLEVVEREPLALYCVDEVCYFIDEGGLVFDLAPTFSEGVYLVYRSSSLSQLGSPLGQVLLPVEDFDRLNRFLRALGKLGFTIEAVDLGGETHQAHLDQGGRLLWSTAFDYEGLYTNLEAFLKSDEVRAEEDFLSRVSELDLTTKNKIRWTMKD